MNSFLIRPLPYRTSTTTVVHTKVVATVDTTAYGLCLVLALFVRLRFWHDVLWWALLTALLVLELGLHAAVGDIVLRPLRGTEQ